MTYKDLQDAVLRRRFDEGSREFAKQWLTDRYGKVWQAAEWPIKDSVQLSLTITAGTATVPVPTGFTFPGQGITVFDNYGNQLDYLEPTRFFESYGASPSVPVPNSYPSAWTIAADPNASGALVFRVGPTPIQTTTFSVSGWNLPIKRTGATSWTLGTMSADTDLPWWPDNYHYFLVPGAQALGLKSENDPTWQPLEDEFRAGLQGLIKEMIPLERASLEQWGGYWSPC